MRARPLLLLIATACHPSSDSTPVLASATIGQEGGVLTVHTGPQAGLQLTVPPGALAAPTAIRILDMTAKPAPGMYLLMNSHMPDPPPPPRPGRPFQIEPVGLQLGADSTLRAPYDVTAVQFTAPGNVRAREVSSGMPVDHAPAVVDVANGFLEFPIDHFGQYMVVRGPIAQTVGAYHQAPGILVPLADGWTFAVEVVDAQSPSFVITRWRITGPGQEDLLYFVGAEHHGNDVLLGRESVTDDWRETWQAGYPVWTPATLRPQSTTIGTHVQRPMSAPAVDGSITVFGAWWWSDPRWIAGQLLYDIVTLRVTLAWQRNDLGVGQRDYVFWFAPGIGLIGLAEDGLLHLRTAL